MKKYLFLTGIVSWLLSSPLLAQDSEEILNNYARHAQFIDIKISPQGNYLAATSRTDEGNVRLTVLDIENMEILSSTEAHGRESVGAFNWANNERVLFSMVREVGSFETPFSTGEILAMNANGSRRMALTGPRSSDGRYVFAEVFDWLPHDPTSVMIFEFSMMTSEPSMNIYQMRVDTGRKRRMGRIPLRYSREGVRVVSDHQGMPRAVVGVNPRDDSKRTIMIRDGDSVRWNEFLTYTEDEPGFVPLAFTADSSQLIGLSRVETDTRAISLLNLESGKEEILAVHPDTDLTPIMSIQQGREYEVIGATYELETLESVFFGGVEDEEFSQSFMGLIEAFPNRRVSLTSATFDNQKLVLRVESANDPAVFFLFNRENNQLTELVQASPWLEKDKIPQTEVIVYQSRDGLNIHALLTLPKDKKAEDLPLIMLPHGGPHGIRDSIARMDRDAKVLAAHGYAVLQPNFRGSGGFGQSFIEAGYKKWGTAMIDDMTDGVYHLVEQGIVDQERICSYGGSYGGYAALQSAIREPDLYKCTVGFVGVFDLDLMFTEGDVPERESGLRYLARVLPEEGEARNAQSPIHNLDKLKAPVFLIHGGRDRRVPQIQADNLRAALEERGHSVEWMVKRNEGHGFYNPANNIERWQRMLEFFDRYIGDGSSEQAAN